MRAANSYPDVTCKITIQTQLMNLPVIIRRQKIGNNISFENDANSNDLISFRNVIACLCTQTLFQHKYGDNNFLIFIKRFSKWLIL